MVTLTDLHGSDAAGNGLALAFGGFASIGLWIALLILLIVSAMKGGWPTWAARAAFFLVPACAAADFIALDLLNDTFYTAKWPIVVPAVAPLVLIAYALWAYFPLLRDGLSTRNASVATWAVVLILSFLPWPEYLYRSKHRIEDQGKAEAALKGGEPQRIQAARQANSDALKKLGENSPLRDWLEFTGPENELREDAFARVRHLARRQSDADNMFRQGFTYLQRDLPELGLEATPTVCEGSLRYFREKLDGIRPRSSDPPTFENIQEFILPYMPGLQWMTEHKCDCSAVLDELERVVGTYADSPARSQFLAKITSLRGPH